MVNFPQGGKDPSTRPSGVLMAACHRQLQNSSVPSIHVLFFSPAVMTFPQRAFKGSFIEAHSSTLTASSSSPHRYLRSHNDYLTESWLNALFYWEGMYSSGNVGDVNKAFIVETEWVASKGMRQHLLGHACRQMKNKQANRERILPYSALGLWWVAQHELLTCKRRWRWAKQWQRQVGA